MKASSSGCVWWNSKGLVCIPYEEKMSLDEPFSIRIDEVTRGTQYYKTK